MIFRDYFYLAIYANLYSELISRKIEPEIAKSMVFRKFISSSFIYKVLFGQSCPSYLM